MTNIRIFLLCGMSDFKLGQKLAGLQDAEGVREITLLRRRSFEGPKVSSYPAPACVARSRILYEFYRALHAFWLCATDKPNVIISFYMYYHGIIAWLLGRFFGVPVVHGLIGTDLERCLRSRRMIMLLHSAKALVVGGAISVDRLVSVGLNRSKIFFPTSTFSVSDYPVVKPEKAEYDLIFVGSLVPVKRVDRLLRIVAALKRKNEEIRLAIVGDGSLRGSLTKLARSLRIADNVAFCGEVAGEDVPTYLCRSKVFVMTSETEGLPMAMIEALSCGIPVLVPDVGDVRCVVRHGENGLLVDVSKEDEVIQALWRLLTDADFRTKLRDGAVATREMFKREYSREAVRKVWESVLENVCFM